MKQTLLTLVALLLGSTLMAQTPHYVADQGYSQNMIYCAVARLDGEFLVYDSQVTMEVGYFAVIGGTEVTLGSDFMIAPDPRFGYDYYFLNGTIPFPSDGLTVTLTGAPVNPTDHPITVNPGSNWIGCPTTVSVPLSTAFAGFTPQAGDVIKTRNASATYYENYGWYGTLETLEPGKGYIYQSNATGPVTFTINASAE